MTTIRTRFAPSPTGFLHVGGARTALFSWLYAKKTGGKFILRIEDTDKERSTDASVQAIFDGMSWLGLDHDEGPFYQSKRFERYQELLEQLLKEGKAYRCYCSKERLSALREQQMADKEKPRYDGQCRHLPDADKNSPHVIRFKNPLNGAVTFEDQIRGSVTFQNSELDDLIIARTDGTPTYNFTVVVDDAEMKITHVIRGDDHINNTPRQINMLDALGATLPIYAHVPMILGDDGKRLSKRHGAVSVVQYREEGILPEALLNYLLRLGWSHGDQEIFSLEEMIDLFDLTAVHKSPAAFNTEKLLWLNQHYMKNLPEKYVAEALRRHLIKCGFDVENGPSLTEVVLLQRERAHTLKEMAEKSHYFYQDFDEFDEKAARKNLKPETLAVLTEFQVKFIALKNWEDESLHEVILGIAEQFDLKLGKVAQPLRVAVTGNTISPPLNMTLRLIGRERVLQRVQRAVDYIES